MFTISQALVDSMVNHSIINKPNECCGILAGVSNNITKVYEVPNKTPSPYRYEMAPKVILEVEQDADTQELQLLAIYHSHTHSPAYPSDTDRRMALESGWVDFCYVLISLEKDNHPVVNFFWIDVDGYSKQIDYKII
jgi:proteasome lid subunit RPN8/RPN11